MAIRAERKVLTETLKRLVNGKGNIEDLSGSLADLQSNHVNVSGAGNYREYSLSDHPHFSAVNTHGNASVQATPDAANGRALAGPAYTHLDTIAELNGRIPEEILRNRDHFIDQAQRHGYDAKQIEQLEQNLNRLQSEAEHFHQGVQSAIDVKRSDIGNITKRAPAVMETTQQLAKKASKQNFAETLRRVNSGERVLEHQYNNLNWAQRVTAETTANFVRPTGWTGGAIKFARGATALGATAVALNGGMKVVQGMTGAEIDADPVTGKKQYADMGTAITGAAQTGLAGLAGVLALTVGGRHNMLKGFHR